MPSRHRIKEYHNDSYYHIYNRGVEKKSIFHDQQDYSVFLSYLKSYILPKDEQTLNSILSDHRSSPAEKEKARKLLKLNNFANEITLLSYCLMPNHFHLLLYQKNALSIDKFMNSLGTRYTKYFNTKYKRIGPLYQGVYKATPVYTDEQLLNLSKYIHKQALSLPSLGGSGQPSSYSAFTGNQSIEWVKPEEILIFFTKTYPKHSYKWFVNEESDWDLLYNFSLEES